jgi:hypothetical protein
MVAYALVSAFLAAGERAAARPAAIATAKPPLICWVFVVSFLWIFKSRYPETGQTSGNSPAPYEKLLAMIMLCTFSANS